MDTPDPDSFSLTCPLCGGVAFTVVEVGFPFRVRLEECQSCRSRLRALGRAGDSFAVAQVGPAYSNCASILIDFRFTREELEDPDLPLYSDAELIAFGRGELPEDLIAPDEVADLPEELDDNEQLLLQMPNVYMWEDRLHPDSALLRLPVTVETGGWAQLKPLGEPRYAHQVETLANGTLTITSRRVIFDAGSKVWIQPYGKAVRILPFPNSVGITSPERNRMVFFKGNYHWPLIFAVIKGAVLSGAPASRPGVN